MIKYTNILYTSTRFKFQKDSLNDGGRRCTRILYVTLGSNRFEVGIGGKTVACSRGSRLTGTRMSSSSSPLSSEPPSPANERGRDEPVCERLAIELPLSGADWARDVGSRKPYELRPATAINARASSSSSSSTSSSSSSSFCASSGSSLELAS